ncbi:hypothetical protein GN299_26545 [Pseudomonas putida]|uniref:Restriction endonuclease type IV Mrr domain-containing protein n=2 Tax=Pseudomonas putida TaxID=303 RepID=A0A7V8EBU0_PSEPU|nr:hypothetical protein GN299_26545 [Pseudomonas putida]
MYYDFQMLSPDEFEALVADLFSAEWGSVLESYKPGKDSGIDLVHSRTDEACYRTIVQCKRYKSDGFNQLYSGFKGELKKLEKIRPSKYVIATSVCLSNANKLKLIELLAPWIKGTDDIYGQNEISTLLSRHERVVKTHFKLWISSTVALEAILNRKFFSLTHFTIDQVKSDMCKLVLHDGYERALSVLNEKNHCIISGNPGIGKTTLAKILLCHYTLQGYEPAVVHNDISDAWTLITRQQNSDANKIAILYDDFLGQSKHNQQKFGKNEESLLVTLIRYAEKNSNIKFIMTTREYIIADARREHSVFDNNAESIAKCTIDLADYKKSHRAKVLFNHLYFSDLPSNKISAVIESNLHKKIIEHEHFNPRIIYAICNKSNSESLAPQEFVSYVEQKLENPAEIWHGPFNNEIIPLSRWILTTLWTLGGKANIEILQEAVLELETFEFKAETSLLFKACLREIDNTFTTTELYPHASNPKQTIVEVSFQNPSISDFIESFLKSEPSWIHAISKQALFMAQYEEIESILKFIPVKESKKIASSLLARYQSKPGLPKGDTYRNHRGDLVFTDNDLYTRHEETLTLLRISEHTSDLGKSHYHDEFITTEGGWSKLLKALASSSTIHYSIRRLACWARSSSFWNIYKKEIKTSFNRALTNHIHSHPHWCQRIGAINALHETACVLEVDLTNLDILKLQHDALWRSREILDDEENIQTLEETADQLEQLLERLRFGLSSLVLDLRRKADSYIEHNADQENSDIVFSTSDSDELDIDQIFSELLTMHQHDQT